MSEYMHLFIGCVSIHILYFMLHQFFPLYVQKDLDRWHAFLDLN